VDIPAEEAASLRVLAALGDNGSHTHGHAPKPLMGSGDKLL
jgi:hypothetical protein